MNIENLFDCVSPLVSKGLYHAFYMSLNLGNCYDKKFNYIIYGLYSNKYWVRYKKVRFTCSW